MKKLNFVSNYDLMELGNNELVEIGGGGFWRDAAYCLGAVARSLVEMGKAGGDYQSSFPFHLKK